MTQFCTHDHPFWVLMVILSESREICHLFRNVVDGDVELGLVLGDWHLVLCLCVRPGHHNHDDDDYEGDDIVVSNT